MVKSKVFCFKKRKRNVYRAKASFTPAPTVLKSDRLCMSFENIYQREDHLYTYGGIYNRDYHQGG